MLQRAGFPISQAISTFDVKHACASGAIALLSVGAMLGASRAGGERGLIICTDEARYAPGSKAEITQGAAAVAILAEPAPRLLAIDLGDVGYSSHDVDDFFRPLGSLTAQVKGRFSIECYQTTVEEALLDLCARTGRSMPELLSLAALLAARCRELPLETEIPARSFYLQEVRADGYRVYGLRGG
jgi:hydroxymethylglutaryl-CoA synthase